MTLRTKVLLIIGGSLLCMVGLAYATSRFTFIRGLEEIEQHDTRRNVERALGALAYLITDMEADAADWAAWDDTYAFIGDSNDEYIQSNLVDETFIKLRLNLMLFVDSSGSIVFGKAFDLENEAEISIPQDLLGRLSGDTPLLSQPGEHSFTAGIILLDEGPMLIASQPILTSEDKGPARGTLIFARYLDSEVSGRLAETTLSRMTLRPLDKVMYPDFKEALPSLLKGEAIFVKPLSTQYVGGYTLLKDVYGEPALMLRVDVPRDTYQLGQLTINYYILSILGLGALVGTMTIFMVQKQVLSRFTNVIQGINRIATSGDTSIRISLAGRDELSVVAGTINGMLGALQESETELQGLYQNEKGLRQEVEEELQKRTEFTRALVHELKTPITPVLAATELLLEEIKDERLIRLAQSIGRGASNLNQRIDELLDLARGETDMLELTLDSVDPIPLLREIGYEMIPVALSNGQSLTIELPPSIPAVWADRGRLRQVVLNLLNNAFKFTPEGGSIILKAKEDGANLVVEVKDTGRGISKEDEQRLFDPYYRIESDRERLSGLGLGLALAKRFVELHGGRIWAEGEQAQGSTFGFSLPLEATSQKERGTNPRGKS
ncbi:CHASE4 domain-containing protein [Chloroflexota bacterium]